MANTFITPSIVAREALMVLRNNCVMANLVHRDYKEEFVKGKGTTVTIRKPATFEAKEFDRTAGITIQDATEGTTSVTLDTVLDVSFEVTAEELSMTIEDFSEQLITPAMQAFAQKIDTKIFALVKDIPYHVGSAGTELDGVDDIADARKKLNDMKVPLINRNFVLGTMSESKLLQLELFISAEKVGDNGTALREASLGRKLGFNFFMDQNVPKQSIGVPGGTPKATGTLGATALTITAGSANGTYKKGDLISIATLTNDQYAVTADCTLDSSGAGTLNIYPGLSAAITTQVVTLTAVHYSNMAFHKNAFAFVNRPLALPSGVAKEQKAIVNFEGFGLRVVYGYDITKKKDIISIDTICGFKTLTPELAVRAISQN
ncbi:MAG TPA: P22 coat protein [Firmicutes bacterium]|jgi:hypothetical protein|nr:P22 coat protein [Bacillota bacterium]